MSQDKHFSMIGVLFLLMIIFMVMVVGGQVLGHFVYHAEPITATVTGIDHYGTGGIFGSSKAEVELSDGSVYDVHTVPEGLRVGQTYTLEYRKPYFMKDPYLVIIEAID